MSFPLLNTISNNYKHCHSQGWGDIGYLFQIIAGDEHVLRTADYVTKWRKFRCFFFNELPFEVKWPLDVSVKGVARLTEPTLVVVRS